MKKRILPLMLLSVLFLFANCGPYNDEGGNSTTSGSTDTTISSGPVCAAVYAVMGKPPVEGSGEAQAGGLYGGAGICSSSQSAFDKAIKLNCCYDPATPGQITISFNVADMKANQNDHYEMYFKNKPSYTFDADYVLSDQNVLTQLGLTTSPRIPGNTPSLSMTNDGVTVTFVMPVIMQ